MITTGMILLCGLYLSGSCGAVVAVRRSGQFSRAERREQLLVLTGAVLVWPFLMFGMWVAAKIEDL